MSSSSFGFRPPYSTRSIGRPSTCSSNCLNWMKPNDDVSAGASTSRSMSESPVASPGCAPPNRKRRASRTSHHRRGAEALVQPPQSDPPDELRAVPQPIVQQHDADLPAALRSLPGRPRPVSDPTYVARLKQWQTLGRQVMKGQSGYGVRPRHRPVRLPHAPKRRVVATSGPWRTRPTRRDDPHQAGRAPAGLRLGRDPDRRRPIPEPTRSRPTGSPSSGSAMLKRSWTRTASPTSPPTMSVSAATWTKQPKSRPSPTNSAMSCSAERVRTTAVRVLDQLDTAQAGKERGLLRHSG